MHSMASITVADGYIPSSFTTVDVCTYTTRPTNYHALFVMLRAIAHMMSVGKTNYIYRPQTITFCTVINLRAFTSFMDYCTNVTHTVINLLRALRSAENFVACTHAVSTHNALYKII